MIIGICGRKQSGKTELAKQLVQYQFYWRLPFTEPFKEAAATMLRLQGVADAEIYRLVWGDGKEEECKYFNGRSARYIQETLGTEWGREMVDLDIWVGIWERRVEYFRETTSMFKNIVVEDMRYPNEAEVIRHHGGKLIRIEREKVRETTSIFPIDDHISESEYLRIEVDLVIRNDSTPEYMLRQLKESSLMAIPVQDPRCWGERPQL
jgi:hypothetical protein